MDRSKKLMRFFLGAPIILLLAILLLGWILGSPPEPIDIRNISILVPDTSGDAQLDLPSHNSTLTSLLQAREAIYASDSQSDRSNQQQARMFYVTILAGLVAILIINSKSKHLQVCVVLLVLIGTMYLLDTHIKDTMQRQSALYEITRRNVELLVNARTQDSIWWTLSYAEFNHKATEAADWRRIWRKLHLACKPDGEQLAYYFFPGFVIAVVGLFRAYTLRGPTAESS